MTTFFLFPSNRNLKIVVLTFLKVFPPNLKVTIVEQHLQWFFSFHFSGQSKWLRRLCWARAMAPWLVNGAKSRSVAPVSLPLGTRWQGRKAKNGITQDTTTIGIKMRKKKLALLSANPTPPWIQMLLNFAIYAINCSNGTRTWGGDEAVRYD